MGGSVLTAHVVFKKSVGKGCDFRQEPVGLRYCAGLGGPKSQFLSNSVDIQILHHRNLATLDF